MNPDQPPLNLPTVAIPPGACISEETAVRFLVGELVRRDLIREPDAELVVCQVLYRERLGSTLIAPGITIPHIKSDAIERAVGIIGLAEIGIPWPGENEHPVEQVCLMVLPASDPKGYLRALERCVRHLREENSANQN